MVCSNFCFEIRDILVERPRNGVNPIELVCPDEDAAAAVYANGVQFTGILANVVHIKLVHSSGETWGRSLVDLAWLPSLVDEGEVSSVGWRVIYFNWRSMYIPGVELAKSHVGSIGQFTLKEENRWQEHLRRKGL